MMASAPLSVIGSQFIASNPLEVIVDKYPSRDLVITDINHKIVLKVKLCDTILHRQRVLLDANDKPIAMLREKNMSMHSTWNLYRGESKADSDIILSAKTEHMIQFKTNVSVTLANKTSSNYGCDLRIKGSWSKKNCSIYLGDSSTIIAQMYKPQTSKHAKDKFSVTIQPNIDYACVVAVLAIVDAIENPIETASSIGGGVAGEVIGAAITS